MWLVSRRQINLKLVQGVGLGVLGEMRYGQCHGCSLEGAVQELQCTGVQGEGEADRSTSKFE